MLGLSLAVFFLPIDPQRLGVLGYGGIFLITLLGAMTLFVPGPTMVAAFLIGATLNPLLVSLFAGLGSAIGETTGYTAGYATRTLVQNPTDSNPTDSNPAAQKAWYFRVVDWMARYPFLTLFVLSAIPNFLTDLSGLIAGRIGYPYWKFLTATFLGKTVRFGMSAYLGSIFGKNLK